MVRISASPSAGSGIGPAAIVKSSSTGAPTGRRFKRTWRLVALSSGMVQTLPWSSRWIAILRAFAGSRNRGLQPGDRAGERPAGPAQPDGIGHRGLGKRNRAGALGEGEVGGGGHQRQVVLPPTGPEGVPCAGDEPDLDGCAGERGGALEEL